MFNLLLALKTLLNMRTLLRNNIVLCNFSEKSVTSDSSGVCTSNSAASYESGQEQHMSNDNFLPGNTCVCIADYNSMIAGHLQLSNGDTVESKLGIQVMFFDFYCISFIFIPQCKF